MLSTTPLKSRATVNCPSQETEVTSTPTRPVETTCYNNKRPTGQKHTYIRYIRWDDGGK
jgi:hypothetical protein